MSKKNKNQVIVTPETQENPEVPVEEGQSKALEPVVEKKPNRFVSAFKRHKGYFITAAASFIGGMTVQGLIDHAADSYADAPDQDDIPEDEEDDQVGSESDEFSD